MRNVCKQLSLTSFFLFIVFTGTPSAAADKNALINDLYHRSGLKMQLDWMQNNFADARALFGDDVQQADEATRKMMVLLDQSLKEKFSDQRVRGIVLDHLDRDLSVQQLEQILEIMDDPIWQRAWELEGRAYQPAGIGQMQQYIAQRLENKPPRSSRVGLVSELIDVTDAVDLTLEMAIQGALMASRIMMEKLGKTEITEKQMEDAARRQMENYREQYRDMLTAQMLYIYRYMSDNQLKAYIQLYSSPIMRKLNNTVTGALLAVMR